MPVKLPQQLLRLRGIETLLLEAIWCRIGRVNLSRRDFFLTHDCRGKCQRRDRTFGCTNRAWAKEMGAMATII